MFNHLNTLFSYLPKGQKGQDAAEYALLIALIALAIILAVTFLGTTISAVFQAVGDTISGVPLP